MSSSPQVLHFPDFLFTPSVPPARNVLSFIFCHRSIFYLLSENQLRCWIFVEPSLTSQFESTCSPSVCQVLCEVLVVQESRCLLLREPHTLLRKSLCVLPCCSITGNCIEHTLYLPCIQLPSHSSTSPRWKCLEGCQKDFKSVPRM